MKFWNRFIRLEFSGAVGGLIFLCLSFLPSLLPRGEILQGVISGITFTIGYGIGLVVSKIYHFFRQKRSTKPRLGPRQRRYVIVSLSLAAAVYLFLGNQWQEDVRELTEAAPVSSFYPVAILVIASLIAYLILLAARGILRLARWFGRRLSKVVPPKVASFGGGLLALIVIVTLVNGVLINSAFAFLNSAFGLVNGGTPEGIHQPQDPLQSGSPDSLIDWNSLGEKGRGFVGSVSSPSDIAAFSGENAVQPSRIYAGLESSDGFEGQAELVIQELERISAKDREAILIAIPTGSGGVNNKSVSTIEYLYGGNSATVAIQYSYLPSWISFLADQEKTREVGRIFINEVYDWWNKLNHNQRPKLLIYGESLGTLGVDGAFSGVADITNRTSGVLLVGPPHANKLWFDVVNDRDDGSRQVLPLYQNGMSARFSAISEDLDSPQTNWEVPRVVFLQHGSDPVVWGSPDLILHKPDWLKEQRGYDVLPGMDWYPFVTFWHVVSDLPFAFSATEGHGHRYDDKFVDSWIQILQPDISQEKAKQLNELIKQTKG